MTALLHLETSAVLRARWLVIAAAAAVAVVAFFVVLATRESSVLAFTGFTRVLTGTGLAGLLFLPLLALFSTVQAFVAARSSGTLEWYLSYPVSRSACFTSLVTPRLVAIAGPIAVAVLALAGASLAYGEPVPGLLLARLLALLVGQAFCFAGIGTWLSVRSTSADRAVLGALAVWFLCVALVDFALIGAMLRWNLPPHLVFLLSAANPVQAGRLGLLAAADPNLGTLGPVGTWVTVVLGPQGTLFYALGWPLALGAVAFALARRRFLRDDVL
jgi:ABC-2 type transport system permease protein